MADNKRLRVSKACDSCRRKKVKCDAIHPLCTNCETFNYECTYNDPTKKRGPPKGKLVPMMTGYIEAIEARLHRMEGLLGGLVKDKDPRAEIVRAELDAMAREAEMTGLKLRRSKAYEEINHVMANSASSSSSAPKSVGSITGAAGGSGSSSGSSNPRMPPSQQQAQHQHPHQLQRHAPSSAPGLHLPSGHSVMQQQPALGYRPHGNGAPAHQDTNSSQGLSSSHNQPMIQPSPPTSVSRPGHYQPYEHSSHPSLQSHSRPSQSSLQRHHSQPSQISNASYQKEHSIQVSQSPSHYQHSPQQQQQQQSRSSHYGTAYRDSRLSNLTQYSSYTDSRVPQNHPRSGSQVDQAHHRKQSLCDQGHLRTGSGGNTGSNSGNGLAMGHRHSYSNVDSNSNSSNSSNSDVSKKHATQPIDMRHLITHRPSMTAHQLSNPLTGYMHIPEHITRNESLIMPSIDVIEHLLEVHFRFVHPVLPMLHYSTLSDQIHRNESPPPHLLFAILGLASRFSDNRAFRVPQPGVERPPCTIFYERAKHFIKDEYDNSQIANVQTLLMMAVQQMGFCESQRAWLYVGMAIRMAQDLGLNKEPSEQELNRNRLQCELRKRTWWSLYIIDRLICAGLGRPLTITRKDCETGFPQQEDDMGDASFLGRTVERPTVIANFVHLITLTMVQGNILEFIKAKFSSFQKSKNRLVQVHSPGLQSDQERECHVDTSAAAFTALDKSLTEWRLGLPESLQNATPQSPHFGLFLHLTYNTLIILLHRPEASVSPMSASLCTQAAATISDITEILMDAKVLTSMFISCLYAIFSAGIVHFMNIPSVRKTEASSSTSSPVVSVTREIQSSHTLSAKTNLKRCIDALKFLASHWVSAARRAKVLEDLLDLKHVSLKDLEMDTFKTSPVGPSWVMESRYKEALVGPRENQDQLRQQCRSKVMAIHSLLANDDEFNKMQRRRSISFPDNDMDGDNIDDKDDDKDAKERAKDESTYIVKEDKHETGSGWQTDTCTRLASSIDNASVTTVTSENSRTPIGLGVLSPVSSAPSAASLVSIRNDNNSATLQQLPESDPAMVLSVSNFDISSSLTLGTLTATEEDGSDVAAATAAGLVRHENGLLTPMTMTTLAQGATSPLLVAASVRSEIQSPAMEGSRRDMSTANTGRRQGAMLDPFSMPSSIEFSERNHDRRSSHTHRTAASAASSPMISSIPGSAVAPPDSTSQPLSLFHESSTHDFPGSKTSRREEQDLVWNDMPPTLGLDEWTAYIGAMMMRWLYASGQSSPCSPTSL